MWERKCFGAVLQSSQDWRKFPAWISRRSLLSASSTSLVSLASGYLLPFQIIPSTQAVDHQLSTVDSTRQHCCAWPGSSHLPALAFLPTRLHTSSCNWWRRKIAGTSAGGNCNIWSGMKVVVDNFGVADKTLEIFPLCPC